MTPNTVILFCALFGVLMLAASAGLCYWMLRAERTRADERADEQDILATFLGGLAAWITFLIG